MLLFQYHTMTAKGKQDGIVEKAVMHKFPLPNADCCILQFIINSSNQKFIQISTGVTACRSHRATPRARKNHSKQITDEKSCASPKMYRSLSQQKGGSTLPAER